VAAAELHADAARHCLRLPRRYGDAEAAREAGCDVVLPRSKFVEDLPGKLREGWNHSDQLTDTSHAD